MTISIDPTTPWPGRLDVAVPRDRTPRNQVADTVQTLNVVVGLTLAGMTETLGLMGYSPRLQAAAWRALARMALERAEEGVEGGVGVGGCLGAGETDGASGGAEMRGNMNG